MRVGNTSQIRIDLSDVTLCAATSVNLAATIRALEASMTQASFAKTILFTDAQDAIVPPGITLQPIPKLTSSAAYSEFMLAGLVNHITTSHCLVVQWDGHVLDSSRWRDDFLEFDYIGAAWPQFADGFDVGNGGFSLRSRRLLNALRAPEFSKSHPEDVCIARTNRKLLESLGLRFADRTLANGFSAEREGDPRTTFGYHGVWHMPKVLGREEFYAIYSGLDERGTIRHDFLPLARQVLRGRGGLCRASRLVADRLCDAMKKRAVAS